MVSYREYVSHLLVHKHELFVKSLQTENSAMLRTALMYSLQRFRMLIGEENIPAVLMQALEQYKGCDTSVIQYAIIAAENVREFAQAKYSNFRVGSALLCSDSSIVVGTNVESSSYGLTICAERSALTSALSAGKTGIDVVVVCTDTVVPSSPCGACRQLLFDYAPESLVIMRNLNGDEQIVFTKHLLPFGFSDNQLMK